MDILTFLQSKGISRRAILALLGAELIQKNNKTITYRKEFLEKGDIVTIVGKQTFSVEAIQEQQTEIVLFNKPVWCVVSKSDPHNQTIYHILPDWRKETYTPIGRLDKDSHGLLILTNDTKLISLYAHPRYNHAKTYIIKTNKEIDQRDAKKLLEWVMYYDADLKKHEKLQFDRCESLGSKKYKILLHWWKKRHIRRAIETINNEVLDLQRIGFGPWELPEDLCLGKYRIIPFSITPQNQ